ncbi:diaminopimelate epimerase-like protein [Paenibacillus larvae subsp. larvae B-3650]|nr:diaminopimelate epimerase-like protein [Paenibacillus larvae subsp. larvae B-3650]
MMNITKMNGLGNDFIVVSGEKQLPAGVSDLAIRLCNRHFGIGADGLVYILPSKEADFMMRIINSDGSEAEQCGNAIRCVAKYVVDHGLVEHQNDEITIQTIGAGIQRVFVHKKDGKVDTVRVDMGEPILNGLDIPTTVNANPVVKYPVEVNGRRFQFTAVSMGNPHCVIYVDDAVTMNLHEWGPLLEVHPLFPKKINVEFATVQSRDRVIMHVWERGAGPTLACGTGACATLVASVLNNLTDRRATISLKGGDLFIEWNEADNHVYMTGPAAEVFQGRLS